MSGRRIRLKAISNPVALAALWVGATTLAFPAAAFLGLGVLFIPVLLLSFLVAPVTSRVFGPEYAGDPFLALFIAAPAAFGVTLGVAQKTFLRDAVRGQLAWLSATTAAVFLGCAAYFVVQRVVAPLAPPLAAVLAGGAAGIAFGAAQFWGLRTRTARSAVVWLAVYGAAFALTAAAVPAIQSAMAGRTSASGLAHLLYLTGLALGVGLLPGVLTLPLLFYARATSAQNPPASLVPADLTA